MKMIRKINYLLFLSLFLFACEKDEITQEEEQQQEEEIQPRGDYDLGLLITNEGPFGTGTGTITYVSEDYQTVNQAIYNAVNGEDLGNIVQSVSFKEDVAYVVVNNSSRIVVVNRYTFEKQAVIETGLDQPRYMAVVDDTGYVTNWGDPFNNDDDFIAVIDLTTNTVTTTIPVVFGPENIIYTAGKLYVAHQGGYGQNDKITVINPADNSIIATIDVGDVPQSLAVIAGDLVVLCSGKPSWADVETAGSIVTVNTSSNTIEQTISFPNTTDHPSNLAHENSDIYYMLNGGVYSMDIAAGVLPDTPLFTSTATEFYYGLTVNNGKLYIADAGDFQSNGILKVYDLSTNQEIESIETGLIPRHVYFNEAE